MLDLTSLTQAISSLEALLDRARDDAVMSTLDDVLRYGIKAGVIKNFEFTYELCWKFMKRWLARNVGETYVDGISRRELFRYSAEHRLIDDPVRWMEYHDARNLVSHTYNMKTSDEVFDVAGSFLTDAKSFLAALESRND